MYSTVQYCTVHSIETEQTGENLLRGSGRNLFLALGIEFT